MLDGLRVGPSDQESAGDCFDAALDTGAVGICGRLQSMGVDWKSNIKGEMSIWDCLEQRLPFASVKFLQRELRLPVDGVDKSGLTALDHALIKESDPLVDGLLAMGAHFREGSWAAALEGPSGRMMMRLLSRENLPIPVGADARFAVVAWAANQADPALFDRIHALGADPGIQDSHGRTLLHVVSDPRTIRLLVRRYHLDPNARTQPDPPPACGTGWDGFCVSHTPLDTAIGYGRTPSVVALLDEGADPNALDEAGRNALHAAGHAELVRVLLSRGASPETRDKTGRTPMEDSLRFKSSEVLSAFLDFGVPFPDAAKLLAFQQATPAVLSELVRRGIISQSTPYPGVGSGLAYLLKSRMPETFWAVAGPRDLASVRATDGSTALHLLVQNPSLYEKDLLALIAEIQCPIDAQNERGETALIVALDGHRSDAVRSLLKRGADPRLADHRGRTALSVAMATRSAIKYEPAIKEWDELIKLLQ